MTDKEFHELMLGIRNELKEDLPKLSLNMDAVLMVIDKLSDDETDTLLVFIERYENALKELQNH